MTDPPKCRFPHEEAAIALIEMDSGCICYPEDRQQKLCAHHFNRSTPLGSFNVIEWYSPEWQAHFEQGKP